MHTHTHTYTHIHTHTHSYTHSHTNTQIHTQTPTSTHMHTYTLKRKLDSAAHLRWRTYHVSSAWWGKSGAAVTQSNQRRIHARRSSVAPYRLVLARTLNSSSRHTMGKWCVVGMLFKYSHHGDGSHTWYNTVSHAPSRSQPHVATHFETKRRPLTQRPTSPAHCALARMHTHAHACTQAQTLTAWSLS